MPAPAFLAMRVVNGTVGVYRFFGGTWSIVGNTFGLVEPALDTHDYTNRVRQLGNDLFVLDNEGIIRKYNSGTGNWDLVQDFSMNQQSLSGLMRIDSVAGGVELWFAGRTLGGLNQCWTSPDGLVWTQRLDSPLTLAIPTGRAFVFEGSRVFWPVAHATADVLEYNRESNSWTLYVLPVTHNGLASGHHGSFAVVNNRLLYVAVVFGSATFGVTSSLFELVGSSFVHLQNLGTDAVFGGSGLGVVLYGTTLCTGEGVAVPDRCFFGTFEAGGSLYALIYGSNDGGGTSGTYVVKLTPTGGPGTTFTEFDQTLDVPGPWRAVNHGGTNSPQLYGASPKYHCWDVLKDTDTNPGTVDVYLLGHEHPINTAYSQELFKWNGDGVLMTSQGSVPMGLAPPSVPEGGGDQIWTSGELNVEIVSLPTPVVGGEEIRFTAWGGGGADKKISFLFDDTGESPVTKATLFGTPSVVSGPGAVPTLNAPLKQLEGVTADGVTVYAINRDNVADGVPSGSREILVPTISL